MTHRRLRYVPHVLTAAAFAGTLIVAVVARAAGAGDDAQAGAAAGANSWCARIPPGFGHPPINLTPVTLQLVRPSVEPVPATDGLIHLFYVAQVTNTQATRAGIVGVVPVDALAGFTPTGSNLITDPMGRDVAGKVQLFATVPLRDLPREITADDLYPAPVPPFSTQMPAGNSGLMYFDVTYTDPAQVPHLLAHAITLATPDGGEPGVPGLTDPVPVGCKELAVLRPPLVGHGWFATHGCCTVAGYHQNDVPGLNGTLKAGEQFAIDYLQLGPDGTCCNGPVRALTSWLGYGTPVLAAAPGVVVAAVDGIPDQEPVLTIAFPPPLTGTVPGTSGNAGNSVIEDIGGGRYITYGHFKPGSIPAWVRAGAHLNAGDLIGRVGNSGGSVAPHMHFQVADDPSGSGLEAAGLPFVFDTQLLEGRAPEGVEPELFHRVPFTIDRTGAGRVQRGLMPERNGIFGYNLSPN